MQISHMKQVIALAMKDLRLMPRNRGGMFFTFVWPILVTVLFGIMFGGGNNDGEQGKIRIAVSTKTAATVRAPSSRSSKSRSSCRR